MDSRVLELELNFESKFFVTMPFDDSDENDLESFESGKCELVANAQEDECVPHHEMKKARTESPPSLSTYPLGLESRRKYTSVPKARSRFSLPLTRDRSVLNRTHPSYSGSSSKALSLPSSPESTSWNYSYIYPITPPPPLPIYNGFQLIGDSQLLRFHHQVLSKTKGFSRSLGYCVSGQKIADLETRIRNKLYTISEKIIMLIGTNDFTHRTPLADMYNSYNSILKLLQENGAKKIILLTVPPVARMKDRKAHWAMLKKFNDYIMNLKIDGRIYPFDLASVFISYDNSVIKECYEEKYTDGKTDLVHLNGIGFQFLQFILDINMKRRSIS